MVIDGSMAITFVKVRVANMANPRRSRRYDFLVDSGAVYTVVPETELKKLGVEPTSEEEFTLANGETFKKSVGNALFEFRDASEHLLKVALVTLQEFPPRR